MTALTTSFGKCSTLSELRRRRASLPVVRSAISPSPPRKSRTLRISCLSMSTLPEAISFSAADAGECTGKCRTSEEWAKAYEKGADSRPSSGSAIREHALQKVVCDADVEGPGLAVQVYAQRRS